MKILVIDGQGGKIGASIAEYRVDQVGEGSQGEGVAIADAQHADDQNHGTGDRCDGAHSDHAHQQNGADGEIQSPKAESVIHKAGGDVAYGAAKG